tara:strand:- start:1714 stop:1896 length:183 start_codon:yes stop_codon:yes gene_type:complete
VDYVVACGEILPKRMSNHDKNVLVEDIAKIIDKAFGREVVRDGDLEPIYDLVDHYSRAQS